MITIIKQVAVRTKRLADTWDCNVNGNLNDFLMKGCRVVMVNQIGNELEYIVEKEVPDEDVWISVKDKLPNNNQDVLIHTDYAGSEVRVGHYNGKEWFCRGALCVANVLHWKPMPKPPKML